jgi:integrase
LYCAKEAMPDNEGMATISKTDAGTYKVLIRKARFGVPQLYKTFTRKEDAEAGGRKTESEIERGAWRDVGGADRMTLAVALEKYQADETPKHRGAEVEGYHIKVLKEEALAQTVLDRITRGNVRALCDRWLTKGYAVATVNRRLTILHAVFECARINWGMAGLSNPAVSLKLKGATKRERRVSVEEVAALCDASDSAWLPAAVRVAVETAMRRGEICKLRWSMVDIDAGVAYLPGRITKAGRPRGVPLSPETVKVLHDLLPVTKGKGEVADDFVLGGLQSHSITQAFARAAKRSRAGYLADCAEKGTTPSADYLADLTFHDLRHEATSRLAEIFSLHELMKIVGHSSSSMLERYYHPRAEDFAKRLRDVAQVATSSMISEVQP